MNIWVLDKDLDSEPVVSSENSNFLQGLIYFRNVGNLDKWNFNLILNNIENMFWTKVKSIEEFIPLSQ